MHKHSVKKESAGIRLFFYPSKILVQDCRKLSIRNVLRSTKKSVAYAFNIWECLKQDIRLIDVFISIISILIKTKNPWKS